MRVILFFSFVLIMLALYCWLGDPPRDEEEEEEEEEEIEEDIMEMVIITPAWVRERPRLIRTERAPPRGVIRSDTQNVHDSVVVKKVRDIVLSLPTPRDISVTVHQIRKQFPKCVGVLDLIERNSIPVHAVDSLLEVDVLVRVYHYCEQYPDAMELFAERLMELEKDRPCTSGRIAQIVDVLVCHKASTISLVTRDVLRREFVDKAGQMSQHGGQLRKSDLRAVLIKEYVDKGICKVEDIDYEIDQWKDTFDAL